MEANIIMLYTIAKEITVNNKKVTLNILQEADTIQKNGEKYIGNCKELNNPIEYYDEAGNRKPNADLVDEELAEDHTGTYYDKDSIIRTISKLNEKPRIDWRKDKPLPYESFNGKKWVTNNDQKNEYEAEEAEKAELLELNNQLIENLNILSSTDHEIIKAYEESMEETELIIERKNARAEVLRLQAEIEEKNNPL